MSKILAKIPHVPDHLDVATKRLVRWYRTPSGLLLGLTLVFAMGFYLASALTDSRWPAWLGAASTVFLGVFLPYRFARQQGVALDAAANTMTAVQGVAQRIGAAEGAVSKAAAAASKGLNDHLSKIDRLEERAMDASLALAKLEITDQVGARLLRLEQREENQWPRFDQRLEALEAGPDELAGLRARAQELETRVGQELTDLRSQVSEFLAGNSQQLDLADKVNGLIHRETLSGSTTGANFQYFERSMQRDDLTELAAWCTKLGLDLDQPALSYIAHEVRVTEDALLGRMAGSLGSAVLRALVLRSVGTNAPHVLEIGSLFGISIAALERSTFGVFDNLTFTAVDPLDGYYKTAELDILTGVPVSRPVFDENMRRAGIDQSRVHLVRHLSTEEAAFQAIEDASVDMLFIDGDHTRHGVECDFRNFVAKVRPTGYIVFDDYQAKAWPDVAEFVDEVVMQRDDLIFIGAGWETAVFRVAAR